MDRHEYEINQLINPKKDIVKSNSKHRDNIETLIQGRRIGGIVGGGSTPEKTPYVRWKNPNGTYCVGIVDLDNKKISILAQYYLWTFDTRGTVIDATGKPIWGNDIVTACQNKGIDVTTYGSMPYSINVGEKLEFWDLCYNL